MHCGTCGRRVTNLCTSWITALVNGFFFRSSKVGKQLGPRIHSISACTFSVRQRKGIKCVSLSGKAPANLIHADCWWGTSGQEVCCPWEQMENNPSHPLVLNGSIQGLDGTGQVPDAQILHALAHMRSYKAFTGEHHLRSHCRALQYTM